MVGPSKSSRSPLCTIWDRRSFVISGCFIDTLRYKLGLQITVHIDYHHHRHHYSLGLLSSSSTWPFCSTHHICFTTFTVTYSQTLHFASSYIQGFQNFWQIPVKPSTSNNWVLEVQTTTDVSANFWCCSRRQCHYGNLRTKPCKQTLCMSKKNLSQLIQYSLLIQYSFNTKDTKVHCRWSLVHPSKLNIHADGNSTVKTGPHQSRTKSGTCNEIWKLQNWNEHYSYNADWCKNYKYRKLSMILQLTQFKQ